MARLLIAILMALVGALVALPNPVASQIDLSGDWNLTLTGDVSTFEPCQASVEQIGVALILAVTCEQPIGSGTLTGSIDPEVGDFDVSGILSGLVGGFLFEFAGNAAPDGSSFQGTWTISDVPAFGGFSGQRKDQPTPTPTNTPTTTPTKTPVPPTPIGGIGIFPGAPGDATDTGGAAVLTWLAAGAVAGALALGVGAWYVRRR